MDPFSRAQQTDEGYSEDPLTLTTNQNFAMAISSLKSPADLPAWLANNVSALPLSIKTELTLVLLEKLPTSVLADIVQRLSPRLYLDFIQHLPAEICLKILGYLDPVSLVNVMQTCRAWYDLVLDRKLWERLYHLEGWKTIQSEIDTWDARVNQGLHKSISHLRSLHHAEYHVADSDEDVEMVDADRNEPGPVTRGAGVGSSIFGTPNSSLSSPGASLCLKSAEAMTSRAAVLDKGKGVDRGSGLQERIVRAKRKEPGGSPEPASSQPPSASSPDRRLRSTLWTWDASHARYRINWKYLYNMRRRLESNWELGKYTTFQLPHPLFPEEGHQECIYTLQFDANYLVSGSRDQSLRIWDMHSRRLVRPPLVGHKGSVLCLQFDADPAEDILVSGSSDSDIFIWKFSTGQVIQKITTAHRESVLNVRFDKRILVTSSKDKTIKIFNRRPLGYGDLGYGVPGGMVNPVPTTVKRYGCEPDLAQQLPLKEPYSLIATLEGHAAAVNAIQVRDDTIVSVSGDRQIKVWNWPDQVCTRTIPAHDKGIACVEFDERRIVSGSSDFEVCIFDAPTGLKVAQLRGHANLVRTVQAGFGDLPNSKEEDEEEAKAVDAEYFRAIEAGEVSQDHDPRSRRSRPVNAGSSRPTEIQAFGAKVPPGGGGGRRYGRIVSGSYDQSIIIWRRDKEGVWKPAHHLRQEEAAAAAQRRMTAALSPSTSRASAGRHGAQPLMANTFGAPLGATAIGGSHDSTAVYAPGDGTGPSHGSTGLYVALIEQVVPLGPTALEQALLSYPGMLAHHHVIQTVIEREPCPAVRAQLRQAVANALAVIESSQAARSRQMSSKHQHGVFALATPGRASSNMATAGTSSSSGDSNGGSSTPTCTGIQDPMTTAALIAAPSSAPVDQAHSASLMAGQGHGNAQHHPHIAAAENTPARVFKLQFDARKIVCCSQAPVIVGWDFCNGEPELEAASRFFATVD